MNDILKSNFYDSILNEFKSINYNMKELPEEKKSTFDFYEIRNLFLIYINWRKRFIGPGFRKVIYSKELKKKLVDKRLKKIVNKIEYKFKNNEDLTPFLTKQIVFKPYIPSITKEKFEQLSNEDRELEMKVKGDKDLLLNLFQIQHLHLEDGYNNRPTNGIKFTVNKKFKRDSELLYIIAKKDMVYFIDVNSHNLYNKEILVVIKENWEYLIKEYESTMQFVTEYSYEEATELFKKGININIKINDKSYIFPPISMVGTSNMEFFYSKKFFVEIQNIYDEMMIIQSNNILEQINNLVKNNSVQKVLEINIVIKNGLLFFVDNISRFTLKLDDKEIQISKNYCQIGCHCYDFNT
jgi:hypothetical protein